MADLARKYERIATDSAPPTPTKSTSKRTMPLVVSGESPAPPSPTPAVVSGLPSIPPGDRPSCFRCDHLRTAVESGENPSKRKRFLASEAEDLKIEAEDKTCSDGNLRREAPASLDAPRRPETRPPLPPAADADAAKVRSACAAEIEAYLSAMEREQQRRFADKYNYDVVNDVPLEGRYEWIPISVGCGGGNAEVTGGDGTD